MAVDDGHDLIFLLTGGLREGGRREHEGHGREGGKLCEFLRYLHRNSHIGVMRPSSLWAAVIAHWRPNPARICRRPPF